MEFKTIVHIEKKALLKGLKFITPVLKDKKNDVEVVFEITVTNGQIRLNTVGASGAPIPCQTTGMGKATLSLNLFTKIVKTFNQEISELEILPGRLRLNSFSMTAQTTFIEDDTILRSITLPINYTDIDLLRLPYQNYTTEEIAFNKYDEELKNAQNNLSELIKYTSSRFKKYEVDEGELQRLLWNMVNNKIKGVK